MSQYISVKEAQVLDCIVRRKHKICETCGGHGMEAVTRGVGGDGFDRCSACDGDGAEPWYTDGLRQWAEEKLSWPMVVWWLSRKGPKEWDKKKDIFGKS